MIKKKMSSLTSFQIKTIKDQKDNIRQNTVTSLKNDIYNVQPTEINLMTNRETNTQLAERHDSLNADQNKIKTAEEQLKFILKSNNTPKNAEHDNNSHFDKNIVLIETESNVGKHNPDDEQALKSI